MSLAVATRTPPLRRIGPAYVVALLVTAIIGANLSLPFGATVGAALAVALLPVWAAALVSNRWGTGLVLVAAVCVVTGVALTAVNSLDHVILPSSVLQRTIMLLQLPVCVGFLLWSHRQAGVAATSIAYGAGAVLGIAMSGGGGTWRFTYSIPLTLLLLAIVSTQRRTWLQVCALGGLAAVGLVSDSRSNSAFLLLAATILIWQRLGAGKTGRSRGVAALAAMAGVGLAVYLLLQAAIVEGVFGEVTQARTEEQLQRSGSLILGGRPEAAASFALLRHYPLGIGSGVKASYQDIMIAKTGMAEIGYDPNNGYVERFMFGSGIEVHSMVGNLWLWFGLPGAVLTLLSAALVLRGLARGYQFGVLTALFVYLVPRHMWDLAFSPVASSMRSWILILSLAIAYATYTVSSREPVLTSLAPPTPTLTSNAGPADDDS